jgi:hypothetical protein
MLRGPLRQAEATVFLFGCVAPMITTNGTKTCGVWFSQPQLGLAGCRRTDDHCGCRAIALSMARQTISIYNVGHTNWSKHWIDWL